MNPAMAQSLVSLHQDKRELFQRRQHRIEGKCSYQREKNQSGNYLIMPYILFSLSLYEVLAKKKK
jgi:stalled ribosome alternative rescue factor ArfA